MAQFYTTTMKSKPTIALFGVLALAAIIAISPSAFGQISNEVDIAKGAGSSANADCVKANNCYAPNPITIAPGTEVEWKNTDTVGHTVTSGKSSDSDAGSVFDSSTSGLIKPGAEFKFTFAKEGTYDYFCMVHPWMVGQVIVSASAASTGTSNSTAVPEFGSIAPIVLAIAVISIVVFTAKNRVIPKL